MRIVITGHKGQLGRQLQAAFAGHEILGLDMPEDDITAPAIRDRITGFQPGLILHAAAYTDVDGCETNPDRAFRVNAVGTQNVALAAAGAQAGLVYISTNEVFDGSRRDLYREWDAVNPTSVYARSKAAGEQIVRDLTGGRFYICRVAWLFGPGGNNFVTKILAGANKHGSLKVAADEFGNPTYAPDLAQAIVRLAATDHYRHLPPDQRRVLLPPRVRPDDHAAGRQTGPADHADPERRLAAAVQTAPARRPRQHRRGRTGDYIAAVARGGGGVRRL